MFNGNFISWLFDAIINAYYKSIIKGCLIADRNCLIRGKRTGHALEVLINNRPLKCLFPLGFTRKGDTSVSPASLENNINPCKGKRGIGHAVVIIINFPGH
ncbi:hypothetical protein BC349_09210 [Flavihumibacter stibioxidans]|uniref:Uncharacterized protein n=1 Tax=Flavihumibacter stibioxidans TaxID=1834163 RepID=A0ABR7M859_9BACT|nr:hypothetical protein [Flavihumibacter stibioxidans]